MSDKKNLQEISPALKLAYRVKAKTAIKELEPHAKKGEYRDLAKNLINKRKAGIAKSMGEDIDMGSNYVNKKTPQEKFKSGLKKAGYDPDAGAKRLLDLIAKQKAERAEHDKKYGHLYGEEVDIPVIGNDKTPTTSIIKKKPPVVGGGKPGPEVRPTPDTTAHDAGVHRFAKEDVDISEAMDPEHPIAKEYQAMKKHDIKTLRNMIKGQHRIVDTSEYRTKDHAISAYLRTKHGDKKVDAAFGLKEEVKHRVAVTISDPNHSMVSKRKETMQKFIRVGGDKEGATARAQQHYKKQGYKVHGAEHADVVNEAAWGQDKMANLRAAHDRHMDKALAANKAGDDAAVKAHQSKMGMIKTQMAKLKQNEEVELEEGTFKYHMDKAIAADQKGDAKKKAYHLDNARTAKFAMKSADYAKNRELLDKHKQMMDEAFIAPALSAANAHAEYARQPKDTNSLKVAIKHVGGVSDYKSIKSHLASKGIKAEVGTGDDYKTVHLSGLSHSPADVRRKLGITEDIDVNEAWNMGNRNPQRGIKVGHKVRSYDFPGMHDDHYVEGHVVGETPSSYHLRVNKVVRAGKEVPVPAHMVHVEAPKGTGMFSQAYAVHKILDKQNQVAAQPDPATGANKTFRKVRGR